jgi:hypothetical protein
VSSKNKQTGRRGFLKQIVKLGAGGAFLATTCKALAFEPPTDRTVPLEKRRSRGYRATPHVQTYYEKAAS